MTPPLPHAAMNASSRRRSNMMRWSIWLIILCLPTFLATWFFCQTESGSEVFIRTCLIALIPQLAAALLIDRLLFVPIQEGKYIILLSGVLPYAALLVLFALLHLTYSRLAFSLSAFIGVAWLWLGYQRAISKHTTHYGVVDQSAMDFLEKLLTKEQQSVARVNFFKMDSVNFRAEINGLVIDRSATSTPDRQQLLAYYCLRGIPIRSSAKVFEEISGQISLNLIDDAFMDDHYGYLLYGFIKRLADVLVVLFTAPIWLSLWPIIAGLIKLDSTGPAIFSQERFGLYGQTFKIFKFRTMFADNRTAATTQDDDPRITRIGKILRRYRLDEIPQLINVLRGDMSLIGPRPEWTFSGRELFEEIPYYHYRHLVRPGISGWAQVQQGHTNDVEGARTKLQYDLYYVKHVSLLLDLLIVLKTVKILLTGSGAR